MVTLILGNPHVGFRALSVLVDSVGFKVLQHGLVLRLDLGYRV